MTSPTTVTSNYPAKTYREKLRKKKKLKAEKHNKKKKRKPQDASYNTKRTWKIICTGPKRRDRI